MRSSACLSFPNALVPKYMNDSSSLWKEKVGDVREFVRNYSIRKAVQTERIDLPVFDETTVIKIFYKASKGLSCRVKIVDSNENVVFESTKNYKTGSFTAILDPDDDGETGVKKEEKGYVIFEYSKNETMPKSEKKEGSISCWSNDVVISMNPYTELIENSKCEVVKNTEFTPKLPKVDNQMFDIYQFDLNSPISVDERIILEKEKLKVRFNFDSQTYDKMKHGTLLILVHYDFAFISMKSKLTKSDGTKNKFLKYGDTDSFEDELGLETAMTQMANSISYQIPGSYYGKTDSYIEAEFSLTDKFMSIFEKELFNFESCFPLNLVVEYVPPGQGADKTRDEDDDSQSRIELIVPAILNNVPISQYHNLTVAVTLDSSIIDAYPSIDPASSLSNTMMQQMCALEREEGSEFDFSYINPDSVFYKTDTVFPIEYYISEDYKIVSLHFPVTQVYEDSCYKLVCRKDPTVIHGTFYDVEQTSGIKTKYCFGKEIKSNSLTSPL